MCLVNDYHISNNQESETGRKWEELKEVKIIKAYLQLELGDEKNGT